MNPLTSMIRFTVRLLVKLLYRVEIINEQYYFPCEQITPIVTGTLSSDSLFGKT